MIAEEFQLLLSCARSEPDSGSIKERVNKNLNWRKLLDLAEHHGVRPMLRQSLKAVCWDYVPQETRIELDRFYETNAQRSLLFAGELLRLFAEFAHACIPAATFKGIILAQSIYGDLALREFSDLDIIVHHADASKVEDILTSAGYIPDFPDRDFRSAFLAYQGQYAFRNKQTGFSVDLHWRLASKGEAFLVRSEDIWSKLEQVAICGRMIPSLALDDLTLLLAAHGTKEGWRFLKWVCDFAEILRKCRSIDWPTVLARAERSYCLRPLQLATFLASTLLDAPAPQKLIDKAQENPAVRVLAEKSRARMLCSAPTGELIDFLNGLNTHDRMRNRLLPVATLLTTRTVGDYNAMPLPKSLWGVYYVTRPFRLAAKAAELVIHPRIIGYRDLD
jgi:hypothetical protein